jgi:hypothetical protein
MLTDQYFFDAGRGASSCLAMVVLYISIVYGEYGFCLCMELTGKLMFIIVLYFCSAVWSGMCCIFDLYEVYILFIPGVLRTLDAESRALTAPTTPNNA